MKKILFLFFIFFSFFSYGQENKLLGQILNLKKGESQLEYILNIKNQDLPEDGFTKLMKIKLNSELNSLADLFSSYMISKDLELSSKEMSILKSRVLSLAEWFVKNEQYITVTSSGGIAPIIGVGSETIANKKVLVLKMGGDCTIDEYDERRNYIYEVFNTRVKSLLNRPTD